ncbi:hypothetical protein [Flavobacterium sp. UBA7663]|uniref:hypothetical protein n=1 Tax=Flavobacterium sp. UBA7663 TaxID=1946557 RepID=UPI0025BE34FC|nr:hypothetical protein [Flavobacterium sp. UBA7663]
MKRIIFIFFILLSLNSFGQTKEKSIYIEINDSSKVFTDKIKDSIIVTYKIFVNDHKYPYWYVNARKNNENQKMISLTEYKKLKTQILSLDLINKMTDEEFTKIIEGKKIYIIDKIYAKEIKKVLVKNLAYVIPD